MYRCDKSSFFDESLLVLSGVKGEEGMAKNIFLTLSLLPLDDCANNRRAQYGNDRAAKRRINCYASIHQ